MSRLTYIEKKTVALIICFLFQNFQAYFFYDYSITENIVNSLRFLNAGGF